MDKGGAGEDIAGRSIWKAVQCRLKMGYSLFIRAWTLSKPLFGAF